MNYSKNCKFHILQNVLFRSYDDNQNLSNRLKDKYNNSLSLGNQMTQTLPHKRPNCEEILERKNKWALNEKEFEINDELEKIIDSKQSENELTIYSLLRSKMISDKTIKSKSERVHNCVIS